MLVALGTAPHLTTMTLSAIYKTYPEEMPTEIHVVTTGRGADCAREAYLDGEHTLLEAFYRDYGLTPARFEADFIHTIPGANNEAIDDIRTADDGARAADYIIELVRELCADPEASLHVSIVGGRKSMGMLLGSAMTFYGRDQDKISHILSTMEYDPSNKPYPAPEDLKNDPDIVNLGEIPFLRLRPVLPAVMSESDYSFGEIVSASQIQLADPPSIVLKFAKNRCQLLAEQHPLHAEKRAMGLYIWLLLREKLHRPTPTSCNGVPYETFFLLRLQFVNLLEHLINESSWQSAAKLYLGLPVARIRTVNKQLMNRGLTTPQDYVQAFMSALNDEERKAVTATASAFNAKLSILRTKFNDAVAQKLGLAIPDVTHRRWQRYQIDSNEQKDSCYYRLQLKAEHISVPEELLNELHTNSTNAVQHWRLV